MIGSICAPQTFYALLKTIKLARRIRVRLAAGTALSVNLFVMYVVHMPLRRFNFAREWFHSIGVTLISWMPHLCWFFLRTGSWHRNRTHYDNIGTGKSHWFQQAIHVAWHINYDEEAGKGERRNIQFPQSTLQRNLGECSCSQRIVICVPCSAPGHWEKLKIPFEDYLISSAIRGRGPKQ